MKNNPEMPVLKVSSYSHDEASENNKSHDFDTEVFTEEIPTIDVLAELSANLKKAQYLQAKLHFMAQEIKECVKRRG